MFAALRADYPDPSALKLPVAFRMCVALLDVQKSGPKTAFLQCIAIGYLPSTFAIVSPISAGDFTT